LRINASPPNRVSLIIAPALTTATARFARARGPRAPGAKWSVDKRSLRNGGRRPGAGGRGPGQCLRFCLPRSKAYLAPSPDSNCRTTIRPPRAKTCGARGFSSFVRDRPHWPSGNSNRRFTLNFAVSWGVPVFSCIIRAFCHFFPMNSPHYAGDCPSPT